MSIGEMLTKIKGSGAFIERKDILVACLIVFVAISSFVLGKLSSKTQENTSVTIENRVMPEVKGASTDSVDTTTFDEKNTQDKDLPTTDGQYVGSKNSNVYHLPWCSGALRINESNKVWFSSKEDAEAKGYRRAGNCKGI